MKFKFFKYSIDVLAIILFFIVGLFIETNFIHKEYINEATPINEKIECNTQETVESNNINWIKCNATENVEMDYFSVKNEKADRKEIVLVEHGKSLDDVYSTSVMTPFDKVDALDQAVVKIDGDISNYDIYFNVSEENMQYTDFEAISFSAFNIRNVIFITMTLSIIFIMARHFKYFSNNIAASFLLLSLLFGLSAVLLNPSIHAFDEYAHFIKAYDDNPLAFMNYKAPSDIDAFINLWYDNSWYEISSRIDLISKLPLTSEYTYTAELYIPFTYFPYHIGLAIASLFTKSIYTIYMAGKVSAVIIHSLLGAYLIKNTKFFKKSIFMLLLFPNVLMIAISYSLDYVLILSVLFLFTTILNVRDSQELTRKDFIILCLSACFIVLIKLPYFLITPIIFILYKYIDKKQFKKLALSYFGVVILALVITAIYVSTKGASQYEEINEGLSTIDQTKFFLSAPLVFFKATIPQFKLIINSFFNGLFQTHFVGGEINYRFGMINKEYIWFAIPLFIMTIFSENQKVNFNIKERILIMICVILSTFGVMGFLYLTFTPVGADFLHGYQLRYFTPLIILIMASFLPQNNDENTNYKIDLKYIIKHLLVIVILNREINFLITYNRLYIYVLVLAVLVFILKNLRGWIVYSDKFMIVFVVMYYLLFVTQIYFLQYNI